MESLANFANGFIGIFNAGAEVFVGFVTGIIPVVAIFVTALNALTKTIGEEKIEHFSKLCAKHSVLRYCVLPALACILCTGMGAIMVGKVLEEKHKPAYYDSMASFLHPTAGLLPHIHASEIFVYMGIAKGIQTLGLPMGDLAIRGFLTALVIILIRGIATEKVTIYLMSKAGKNVKSDVVA